MNSTVQPDVYELVWREFKRTLIHEVLLLIWAADLKAWNDSINRGRSLFPTAKPATWEGLIIDPVFSDGSGCTPFFLGGSRHYRDPHNNRFFHRGFPLPEQGGILHQWDDKSRIRIFMDDLFLCPDCGNFYSLQYGWPNIPWLDEMECRTDVQTMFEAIEQRRHSKEFNYRLCENREHCEQTVDIFRAEFERENKLEDERLAWATKVKEIEQRILAAPNPVRNETDVNVESDYKRYQFVYLIESNGCVKGA